MGIYGLTYSIAPEGCEQTQQLYFLRNVNWCAAQLNEDIRP